MKLPFNLICIDLETTDTDNEVGSIVQLGAFAVTPEFKICRGPFSTYVQPLDNYRNPEAMRVNKITEEQLKDAPPLVDVLKDFEEFCKTDKFLSSWGAYFDIPFLRMQYKKIGREYPFSYRSFDLKTVAIWEAAKKDIPVGGGVGRFLKELKLPFDGKRHDAVDDIKNSIKIIKNLGKL